MGQADFLRLGDWNAQCYECGRKFKSSDMIRHWQGYYVCVDHWEPRHPQDFVRGSADLMTPPWTQPQPAPTWAPDAPQDPIAQPSQYPIVGDD